MSCRQLCLVERRNPMCHHIFRHIPIDGNKQSTCAFGDIELRRGTFSRVFRIRANRGYCHTDTVYVAQAGYHN